MKAGYSSLGLIVNASVTVFCLYIVKLYALYFASSEDINAGRGTSMTSGTVSRRRSMMITSADRTPSHNSAESSRRRNPVEFASGSGTREISTSGIASGENSVQHESIPEERNGESPRGFVEGSCDENRMQGQGSLSSANNNKIDDVVDINEVTQTESLSEGGAAGGSIAADSGAGIAYV